VTGHHPVTEHPETDTIPMYPALNRMERRPELQPRRHDREPYWRAPITPASADVYIPHWNWQWRGALDIPGQQLLTLDANGAYLAALGSLDKVAHSHLSHTGTISWPLSPREVLPGYYRIQVPHWNFDNTIVSPLGDSSRLETENTMWVAHPTLVLLLELLEEGVLGDLQIEDSWTAQAHTHFRKWAAHLRQMRTELLDAIAQGQTEAARAGLRQRYDAFKEGYSAALSMMLTGDKCRTQRPDWTHAVYAQHAATMWRKGWRWTATGHPLIGMGHTDELTVLAADLPAVMSRPKPPFRFDPSGVAIGALKPKTTPALPAPRVQTVAALNQEEGDIL
jgi:hypothetical protein